MTNISATLYEVGEKIDNYLAPATAFDALDSQEWTVPAYTRWFLLGGLVTRDANETVTIYVTDGTNNIIELLNEGAGTGTNHYPEYAEVPMPLILDAGDTILVTFGGNQGAGAALSCVVVQVPHM